ncbi:NAD-dependent epimerase/dehydratase family protein [Halomonas sp. TRM85114]|uniref:polysaccharide biosynthesis C-terminal domain-containing protein n=1 Tax=Halomonas jincaotanensis TaxID=2810616 RepID=UPI001BD405BF|nr:NAD-dependent epimerase/dehydratase family protein [Halomonas jincaotanensis]MBS9404065.1 NAD-dependent epimerase/dehydratase family protein [Halomonas jincaotanensis]
MKIVITGANGLLGRHVHLHLRAVEAYRDQLVPLDRHAFQDDEKLAAALGGAGWVIHCAGINRDSDERVEQGNRELAERLAGALERVAATPHLFYANTIQRDRDVPYGRGKQAANRVFDQWAARQSARYTELVLPHVFGEGGRPHYNSAVHTFCHQLAAGEELAINGTGQLELLHAQDIAAAIVAAYERGQTGELRLEGRTTSVASAAGKLIDMHRSYTGNVIPDLRAPFDLQLFNTLRSFLYPRYYPKVLTLHSDERGALFEGVKNRNGGQAFLSTTKPGITRGNHYHFHKVERFLVVKGQAVIRIRRLLDDQVEEFHVSGDAPAYVDMPTLHTHSITNTGDEELLTMFWSHEIFDPAQPDTCFEPVLDPEVTHLNSGNKRASR